MLSRPWVRFFLAAIVLLGLAHLADGWVWAHAGDPRVGERDWGRLLRVTGFFPTWILVALAIDRERGAGEGGVDWFRRRGARLVWSAGFAGLLAELLKILVRRLRPDAEGGEYLFRAWSEGPFSTGGLGFPSSHTAVAFGAAFALAGDFPRARWVFLLAAAGCGYTRLAAGRHFLSDVAGGLLVGYAAAVLVERWSGRPRAVDAAGRPRRPGGSAERDAPG